MDATLQTIIEAALQQGTLHITQLKLSIHELIL